MNELGEFNFCTKLSDLPSYFYTKFSSIYYVYDVIANWQTDAAEALVYTSALRVASPAWTAQFFIFFSLFLWITFGI